MSEASRVGTVLAGKYRLEEELGRGGMGAVYRARHLAVHKEFAIKLLLGDLVDRKSIVSRFFLEAQAAGRIGHQGILDVYDVGEDTDGTPFIVMELLTGEPLSALIRRGPIEIDAACWIAMQVLDVLAAAHQAGIIHRDVKPQNVFLTERAAPSGSGSTAPIRGVKLLDFGIAKFGGPEGHTITRSGEIIGSPLYMAPEQAKGDEGIDARADVWSVGAMMFEMLTGQCAHVATTPVAVLAKILTERAPPASARREGIPSDVDGIVARALEIDRTARWRSAREMHDALAEVRARLGTAGAVPALPAAPPRASIRPAEPASSHTPGALSSTVLERPDTALAAAPTQTSEGDAKPKRGRYALLAAAALALGAVVVVSTRGAGGDARAPEAKPDAAVGPVVAIPAPPAERAASPQVVAAEDASVVADAGAPRTTPPAASSPAPAVAAQPGTGAAHGSPAPGATVHCEPHEVLSSGHCCPRGQAWQDGRCERPLATTF